MSWIAAIADVFVAGVRKPRASAIDFLGAGVSYNYNPLTGRHELTFSGGGGGGSGDVVGPANSVDSRVALFNGITGKLLKQSANLLSDFVLRSGANAFTGDQSMGGHKLTNLGPPSAGTDAATKAYADSIGGGAADIAAVALATTGNITLSGEQTIDGTLTSANRVLVWKQTVASQNGIYVSGAGAWTRATDQDGAADFRPGAWFLVAGGTQHGGKLATLVTPGVVTPGTTSLTYAVLPVSSVDPTKGQSAIFNGSAWTLSGIATRSADLPNADVSVQVSEGNRFVLSPATLSANRAGTLLLTGAVDKEIVMVERYDATAFTYAVKNSLGAVLYTFPAGQKRMASFQYSGEWSLLGHMAATGG